ncbi:CDGSH iron-sulfur domain-containing protein [Streptomyces sp. NPDC090127]|uniref:CDGSH iron-sulfur domain-containing protein n=1 Tax=Streptomyces sp. NPDC090127 TaxID=3365953 RepID=UPI003806D00A
MPSAPENGTRDGARGPARRVVLDPQGPVLVEGPVEVTLDDGTVVRSDRFMVALCTCRRSRTYPWCDTSHRPRDRHTHEKPRTAREEP